MPFKDPVAAKAYRDGYRARNRQRLRDAAKRRHHDHRDAHLAYLRDYRVKNLERLRDRGLKRMYGVSAQQYQGMLDVQGGVCAICKKTNPSGTRLSVDHDHATKEVRGFYAPAAIGQLDSSGNL